jgi:hypothetical protein
VLSQEDLSGAASIDLGQAFTDVSKDDDAYLYIQSAAIYGWLPDEVSSGEFLPDEVATRGFIAATAVRALGYAYVVGEGAPTDEILTAPDPDGVFMAWNLGFFTAADGGANHPADARDPSSGDGLRLGEAATDEYAENARAWIIANNNDVPDENVQDYDYTQGVLDLMDEGMAYTVSDDQTLLQITSWSNGERPAVGDVVLLPSSIDYPEGLAVKIISADDDGVYEVTQPTIDETFDELHIVHHSSMTLDDMTPSVSEVTAGNTRVGGTESSTTADSMNIKAAVSAKPPVGTHTGDGSETSMLLMNAGLANTGTNFTSHPTSLETTSYTSLNYNDSTVITAASVPVATSAAQPSAIWDLFYDDVVKQYPGRYSTVKEMESLDGALTTTFAANSIDYVVVVNYRQFLGVEALSIPLSMQFRIDFDLSLAAKIQGSATFEGTCARYEVGDKKGSVYVEASVNAEISGEGAIQFDLRGGFSMGEDFTHDRASHSPMSYQPSVSGQVEGSVTLTATVGVDVFGINIVKHNLNEVFSVTLAAKKDLAGNIIGDEYGICVELTYGLRITYDMDLASDFIVGEIRDIYESLKDMSLEYANYELDEEGKFIKFLDILKDQLKVEIPINDFTQHIHYEGETIDTLYQVPYCTRDYTLRVDEPLHIEIGESAEVKVTMIGDGTSKTLRPGEFIVQDMSSGILSVSEQTVRGESRGDGVIEVRYVFPADGERPAVVSLLRTEAVIQVEEKTQRDTQDTSPNLGESGSGESPTVTPSSSIPDNTIKSEGWNGVWVSALGKRLIIKNDGEDMYFQSVAGNFSVNTYGAEVFTDTSIDYTMSDPSFNYEMWYHFERNGDTLTMTTGVFSCEQYQRTDEDINAAWERRKEYEPVDTPRANYPWDGVYESENGDRMVITNGGARIRVSSSEGFYSFGPSSSSSEDEWTNDEIYVLTGDREPHNVGDHQEEFHVKSNSHKELYYSHRETDWVDGKWVDYEFHDEFIFEIESNYFEDSGYYYLVYEDPYLQ